jgi:UrcA family protein
MLKPLVALAALVSAGALVVPTVSQAAELDTRSVAVSYSDLNLASSMGRRVLERRMAWAAQSVCEIEAPRSVPLDREMRSCRTVALEGARPQFEAAVAATLHPSVTVGASAAVIVSAR